jgi:hypothetical protein
MSKLFCDCKTDEEKSNFFLSGRGVETGVIAPAISNEVAMAFHRCFEFEKQLAAALDDLEVAKNVANGNVEAKFDAWKQLDAMEHELDAALAAIKVKDEALRKLSFNAQTTGGVAGKDEDLCRSITYAEEALAIQPDDSALQAFAEKVREQCAQSIQSCGMCGRDLANEIRAIKGVEMTTREQIIDAAKEASMYIGSHDDPHAALFWYPEIERFYAIAFEAGRVAELEACFSLKKEALEIFNFNPLETSQEVRDVIEWFSGAIRTRGTK